jgi:signal transduction histidine kinase
MTLRRKVVLTAAVAAIPAAALMLYAAESRRAADMKLALERVVEGHLTESVRDACQSDPQWFLAGPRTGRPSQAARQAPDADVFLPRPSADELPFELFAYDDQFSPTSTAGPRFPVEFRNAMRSTPPAEFLVGSYASSQGDGMQMARLTSWSPGPCAVLLFRMQPVPGVARQRALMFGGAWALCFVAMVAAFSPTLYRLRRTSLAIGEAAREQYSAVAPDNAKDEISSVAFVFNDAATEIHRRGAENKDRTQALRRHVEGTAADVAVPLATLEDGLAALVARSASAPHVQAEAGDLLRHAHDVAMRLENLNAAATLRMDNKPLDRESADAGDLVRRVVERHQPLARLSGVTLAATLPNTPVPASLSPLVDRALANVVDNALRHTPAGGRVDVRLEARDGGRAFSIRVTDSGTGVTADVFQGLTAVRRFRGDEGWNRRPGAPGLGLAVAREIADRSGLTLELRRPDAGGFEAELMTA